MVPVVALALILSPRNDGFAAADGGTGSKQRGSQGSADKARFLEGIHCGLYG